MQGLSNAGRESLQHAGYRFGRVGVFYLRTVSHPGFAAAASTKRAPRSHPAIADSGSNNATETITSMRYQSRADQQGALRLRLKDLAAARVRWGYAVMQA